MADDEASYQQAWEDIQTAFRKNEISETQRDQAIAELDAWHRQNTRN